MRRAPTGGLRDVGGEGVALRAGAQRGGQFQERGDRLVQGVAAGVVPLGAQGLDGGLGQGVLGPQGGAGFLAGLGPGVLGGAVQGDAAVVAAGHPGGVMAADGHPAAGAGEPSPAGSTQACHFLPSATRAARTTRSGPRSPPTRSSPCGRTPPHETTSRRLVRKFPGVHWRTCRLQRYDQADPATVIKVRLHCGF